MRRYLLAVLMVAGLAGGGGSRPAMAAGITGPVPLVQDVQFYYGRGYYGPRRGYYGRPFYRPGFYGRGFYGPRFYGPRFYGRGFYGRGFYGRRFR